MLNQLKHQRGLNLVEVLVTIIITTIGLVGLNSLYLKTNRSTMDSGNKSQAVWMLEDLGNRMRSNLIGLASYATDGEVSCASLAAPKVCSSYHSGAEKIIGANNCTPAEQAASDVFETLCGFSASVASSDFTFSNAANFISNPGLTVDIGADKVVEITLTWDVRTSGVDQDGNTVYAVGSNSDLDDIALRASVSTRIYP